MGDLRRHLVLGKPEELKDDVQREARRHEVLNPEDKVHTDVKSDRRKVHRSEARIDDHHEHKAVPEVQKRTLGTPFHTVLTALFDGLLVFAEISAHAHGHVWVFASTILAIVSLVQFLLHVLGTVDEH